MPKIKLKQCEPKTVHFGPVGDDVVIDLAGTPGAGGSVDVGNGNGGVTATVPAVDPARVPVRKQRAVTLHYRNATDQSSTIEVEYNWGTERLTEPAPPTIKMGAAGIRVLDVGRALTSGQPSVSVAPGELP